MDHLNESSINSIHVKKIGFLFSYKLNALDDVDLKACCDHFEIVLRHVNFFDLDDKKIASRIKNFAKSFIKRNKNSFGYINLFKIPKETNTTFD